MIDGKRRVFYNRRFCLGCSPFGTHNTRDLTEGEYGTIERNGKKFKRCRECQTVKPFDDFYAKSEWGRRYAVCSSCSRGKSKQRRLDFKKWCVEYKGGSCVCCGYNRCFTSMDFHHRDENKKDFQISTAWKMPKEKVIVELDKCTLVCRNCHGEVHEGIREIGSSRGT